MLWFPNVVGSRDVAEWHYLPYQSGREERMHAYVQEVILGPVTVGAVPYIPRDVAIRLLILDDDGTLYIDFDDRILFAGDTGEETDFVSISERLRRSLRHNFPYLDRIVITVEGHLPGEPRFARSGR